MSQSRGYERRASSIESLENIRTISEEKQHRKRDRDLSLEALNRPTQSEPSTKEIKEKAKQFMEKTDPKEFNLTPGEVVKASEDMLVELADDGLIIYHVTG